jgi:hypothetical protein
LYGIFDASQYASFAASMSDDDVTLARRGVPSLGYK